MTRTQTILALSLLFAGCADATPATLSMSAPLEIVGPDAVVVQTVVANKAGEPLEGHDITHTVVPDSVATFDESGLRCLKSGEVGLQAAGAGLNANATITCVVVAKIELPEKLFVIAGGEPSPLPIILRDADGKLIEGVAVTATSTNEDVLAVDGISAVGKATGIASLIVKVHGVEAKAAVEVVEVESLNAPAMVAVPVDNDEGRELNIQAKSLDGKTIESATVTLTSSAPDVMEVRGNRVIAKGFGTATITATAGGQSASVEAFAVQKIAPRPLKIIDGEHEVIPFEKGNYILFIKNKAVNGTNWGLTAKWHGATCKGSRESKTMILACDIVSPASLVLANPSTFGLGPAQVGELAGLKTAIPTKKAAKFIASEIKRRSTEGAAR